MFTEALNSHIYIMYVATLQQRKRNCRLVNRSTPCFLLPSACIILYSLPIRYNSTRKGKSVTISLNAQILHLLALYSRLSRSLVARFRFRLGVPCISLSVSLSKNATWFGWWLRCSALSLFKQPTLLFCCKDIYYLNTL